MSKLKTISGHYDTAYNLDHNNRIFIPNNVDERRIPWNYNCVAAGQDAYFDPANPRHIAEFWSRYKELNTMFWPNRSIAKTLAYDRYQANLEYMRRFAHTLYPIPHNPVEAFITLLFLPILIPCGIHLHQQHLKAKAEWEQFKNEQWIRDMTFNAARNSLRNALHTQDLANGTNHLHIMEATIRELSVIAQTNSTSKIPPEPICPSRFATLEEIYNKLYEPAFQAFQIKQRPCRRYNGTYLEQIREGQHKVAMDKQQSKNVKSRKTAEAIEIVFTIGDKDNTGYVKSFSDAKCSEEILGNFCDHLLAQPNLCTVTTKELNDTNWQPPFKNGLIILNLTVHADEATPGIHLTCIPYSRDCKRGPSVQASMGRAFAGMGYPSTWKYSLDEGGEHIPKKDRNGNIIYNRDGSIRYQQEPDKQGIVDWIEEQKQWIQREMKKRYDWDREYKGSHPRGNLSTPDYQAARAKERLAEYEQLFNLSLQNYQTRVEELTTQLDTAVDQQWQNATNQDIIERYLQVCTDAEYDSLVETAAAYLDKFALREQERLHLDLVDQIYKAAKKQQVPSKYEKWHPQER